MLVDMSLGESLLNAIVNGRIPGLTCKRNFGTKPDDQQKAFDALTEVIGRNIDGAKAAARESAYKEYREKLDEYRRTQDAGAKFGGDALRAMRHTGGGICGQAFTPWCCLCCGKSDTHPNTGHPGCCDTCRALTDEELLTKMWRRYTALQWLANDVGYAVRAMASRGE